MNLTRPLTQNEHAIIRRLLHSNVERSEELLAQTNDACVEVLDNDDSLVFVVSSSPSPALSSVSEGQCLDSDGIAIHFSALVSDGILCEIDIYKDDGSLIKTPAVPSEIEVYWPAESGTKGWWEK